MDKIFFKKYYASLNVYLSYHSSFINVYKLCVSLLQS